jgi:hypothetical protein
MNDSGAIGAWPVEETRNLPGIARKHVPQVSSSLNQRDKGIAFMVRRVRRLFLALALLIASSHALEGGWDGVAEGGAVGGGASAAVTWGNVSGRVLDAWGKPSAGVTVAIDAPLARRVVVTDSVGFFLVSGIPLAGDADTVVATVEDGSIWSSLRLACPPGAVMAPRLLFQPGQTVLVSTSSGSNGPAGGGRAARAAADATPWAGPWTVFATREGLVGFTTANGHVIKQADHFVALPSRRALNASDTAREFMVELVNGAKRVQVPVMDVGPWNTKDDWWHDTLREMFADLPRGTPEALAAFRDGYNGGLDGSGRKVLNAAGIDLADGVFWDDLGLVNNANIEVRLMWKLTATAWDRVRLKQWANVRDSAGGKLVFKAPCGESGTIAGAPRAGLSGSKWYLYWPVDWDRGVKGWVVENYLTRDTGSVPCTDAVTRRTWASARLRAEPGGVSVRLDRPVRAVVERVSTNGRILSQMDVSLEAGLNRVGLPRARGLEIVRVRGTDVDLVVRRVP